MIKISNLDKYYNKGKQNEIHVINDTSLELPSKGLISLLGQSGSGKTTLLNVIGGLDKAKGIIEYDDLKINGYKMSMVDKYRSDNIGYIFQNYNLLPEETVYNNLVIALEMIGITDVDEIDKRIEYTLKSVGMYKFRKKQAFALSGGQQQRVAIARALIKNAKVIIADEPTGNLDSENTIEVMNILKKISKNTLVLLVTHDINIARFYSDYIIELKDGMVYKSYDNDTNSTLAYDNANTIYLKDMILESENTRIGNINLYKSDNSDLKVDIDIIVRNGNIYIKSNQQIKLFDDSNLKIINDHYRDLNSTVLDKVSYDTTWFKRPKMSFKVKIGNFTKIVKKALKAFINTDKRGKALYFAFGLMGMLIGASVICMINFATPDTEPFTYAEDYYQLTSENHVFVEDPINNIAKNYNEKNIDNVSLFMEESVLHFEHHTAFHKKISLNLNLMVSIYNDSVSDNIIVGRAPKKPNEIIVDFITARKLADSYGVNVELSEILDDSVELYVSGLYAKVVIVGVCDGSQRVAYGTKEFYTDWCCNISTLYFGTVRFNRFEVDSSGNPLYTVVEGRDVSPYDLINPNPEILLAKNSEYYGYSEYIIDGVEYNVVGYFESRSDCFKYQDSEVITNKPYRFENKKMYENICMNTSEYVLLEGRNPSNLNECIVSIYNGRKIGDVYNDKTIVGIYNGTMEALSTYMILDMQSYIISNYSFEDICFQIVSDDLIVLGDEAPMSLFRYQERASLESQASNLKIFEALSIVLVVIGGIFIYFVMRSKMFSDIYNIGVYRCLGATRSKIIGRKFLELVILTTFTALMGYLFILLAYNFLADSINDLLKERMFKLNNAYFLLGMLGVYVMNLIVGIIPICLLLRKTPSEICAKYDI